MPYRGFNMNRIPCPDCGHENVLGGCECTNELCRCVISRDRVSVR